MNKMDGKLINLSAPWYTIHRELLKLFEKDPEVTVSELNSDFREKNGVYNIIISSPNYTKLTAIEKVIKNEYSFGHIKVYVKFTSENADEDYKKILHTAFDGNGYVSDIVSVPDFYDEYYFVVFEGVPIQFYDDEAWDLYGNWNGLLTDVAKDLFKDDPNIKFTIKKLNGLAG